MKKRSMDQMTGATTTCDTLSPPEANGASKSSKRLKRNDEVEEEKGEDIEEGKEDSSARNSPTKYSVRKDYKSVSEQVSKV